MNIFRKSLVMAIAAGLATQTLADESGSRYTPDSHAPAGVMADHIHGKGEWMAGYRYMREEYSDMYAGSSRITPSALAAAGYSMTPSDMTMEMHMLDLMYAPTDSLTLMLMPQYMSMAMSMMQLPSMNMGGGHATHGAGAHRHKVSGIGDTQVAALFSITDTDAQQLHVGLGFSIPTGSVKEKNPDNSYVHYGMQPGTGTWDFLPSLTYRGARDHFSWGAQLSLRLPVQDDNDAGFAVGERYNASVWSALRANEWISVSLRLSYRKEGNINGHYNGAHSHTSPPDRQANYGGEFLDYAIGVNAVAQEGPVAGLRLGLEWVGDVSASYNGYQIGRDDGLLLSLSKAY